MVTYNKPLIRTHNAPISRFRPNIKTCPKSKDNDYFGHPLTLGASSDAFFVMSAEKLAIFLAGPILASLPVRVNKTRHNHITQHTTHNNQNELPPPYPPPTLPSLSMRRLLAPPTNVAAAPYGPTQGARGWVWRRDGWFACLGGKMKPHKKILRNVVHWP
jgi:hypothetical protein